jgi:RimJ/RimL family protein N-acetyltransferase
MITIRLIRSADAAGFHDTLGEVCRERRYLATIEGPPLANVEKFVNGNVSAGHAQFVAEDEGRIVGWCDAIPGEHGGAHIGRLGMGVLKDYRGQKIGQRLLEATIERCWENGLQKIELSVYSSNEAAMQLYKKLGFVEEGVKKRGRLVDGIYDDVVLMALFPGGGA